MYYQYTHTFKKKCFLLLHTHYTYPTCINKEKKEEKKNKNKEEICQSKAFDNTNNNFYNNYNVDIKQKKSIYFSKLNK